MFKDGLLRGRRILVTGGGTGLGKGMAEKFLALGAEVFICGRRKSVCEATAAELMAKHGGKVTSYGSTSAMRQQSTLWWPTSLHPAR
jgi:short-subunit dehydrogenase involved in D-alanine esterification of teichoic acids